MHLLLSGLRDLGVEPELMYLGRLGNPLELLRARAEVARRSHQFDVVHAQFGSACALASATAATPKIVSLRGSDWHRYRGPHRAEARHASLAYAFTRLSLSAYDAVITMSQRMSEEVSRALPYKQVVTLPDPVDNNAFRPRNRAKCREEMFGTADTAPWVLFTTLMNDNPIKRADIAREAVQLARSHVPGIQMKVATGIPHSKMPWFVAACNAAICTSTHEGWPNSIKEALACGLPFVSTDVSDLRQVAAMKLGSRICTADPQELADALRHAIEAPNDDSIPAPISAMAVQPTSQKLLDLYKKVLGQASTRSA